MITFECHKEIFAITYKILWIFNYYINNFFTFEFFFYRLSTMVICFTKHLLDQKSRLSKIWLAAHYEKKIKRNHIFEVNIEETIQHIMEAEVRSLLDFFHVY